MPLPFFALLQRAGLVCALAAFGLAAGINPAAAQTYGPANAVPDVSVNDIQAATVAAVLSSVVGQSFEAGLDGTLARIDVFSNGPVVDPDTIRLDVFDGDGLAGALLGTGTFLIDPNALDPATGGYPVSFDLSGLGIMLQAGSTYTFALTGSQAGDLTQNGILANDQDIYGGGRAYATSLPDTGDLYFQTFVARDISEGGMSGLLALGLTGFGAVAWRTRRRR